MEGYLKIVRSKAYLYTEEALYMFRTLIQYEASITDFAALLADNKIDFYVDTNEVKTVLGWDEIFDIYGLPAKLQRSHMHKVIEGTLYLDTAAEDRHKDDNSANWYLVACMHAGTLEGENDAREIVTWEYVLDTNRRSVHPSALIYPRALAFFKPADIQNLADIVNHKPAPACDTSNTDATEKIEKLRKEVLMLQAFLKVAEEQLSVYRSDLEKRNAELRLTAGLNQKLKTETREQTAEFEAENKRLKANIKETDEPTASGALLLIARALELYLKDGKNRNQKRFTDDITEAHKGMRGLGDRTISGLLAKANKALDEASKS